MVSIKRGGPNRVDLETLESQTGNPANWRMSRRRFLKAVGGMTLGAATMGLGGIAYMTKIEPGWLEVVSVELSLPRLEPAFAGFRLAQISDLHISKVITGEYLAEAVGMVLDSQPDLVAITGDFLHYREDLELYIKELGAVLRTLSKNVTTIAVLGNHDYWVSSLDTDRMLYQAGVRVLVNRSMTLQRGSSQLHFVGMDDIWDGKPRLRDALRDVPQAGAAILLAHEPDYADVSAANGRFDLQISGHSHGGQVVFPWIGPPVRPYLAKKYPSGLYRVGQMYQYTNRGLGMTGPYVRLNCRPEITLFTLQPRKV
jgi:predicted MPP superfamily phosphohydrolase